MGTPSPKVERLKRDERKSNHSPMRAQDWRNKMTITLTGQNKIDWVRPEGCPSGFEPRQVISGNSSGGMALEIAITAWNKNEAPGREALTRLHTIRVNKRATPVVIVVELDGGGALVFGPNPASAPLGPLPEDQTQRVIQASLDEPTVIAARTRLAGLMQSIDSTAMPGVKNSGLFANHELRVGVPQRADWKNACDDSTSMLSSKGSQLIEKLGFSSGHVGAHALLLTGLGPRPEAIAVMLNEKEAFDADSPRFAISPVAYGLKMAAQQKVPWLIMLRGTQLRLYPARIQFGVGRKGLAETFFEVDLPQLTKDNAGYVDLVFSAKALAEGGSTFEILKSSNQYAVELGIRLRDKVYEEIIPELSVAIADALIELDFEMDAEGLDLAYQLTLRVFFRMLFQVYAEDRKLLPYGENTKYDRNAIKTVAKDLVENPDQDFDSESTALWDDLAQVWRVIDSGDKAWGVPAYNGGLFSSDKELNEHGAILKDIHISNDVMGPVLKALLLDDDEEGEMGQIDFRSLSVREFGTIYEGLLESSLGLAEIDLTLDKDYNWVPAKKKDDVYAYAGQVYFHNTSGQRKGTGSYFTPSFVVEHLLERALDPALDTHLAKIGSLLAKGDQAGAAELFFDFRVADLAMGSGHFLTAAIDHIEQKMAAFLAEDGNYIPGVAAELLKLEEAAISALGPDAPEPERSSLLRRQIARRCVYGLDINPIAVELARVSIWIHTFVRGLPMSSLDHNLICGNSLTGIGNVEEALDVLVPGRKGKMSLFDGPIEDALENARKILVDASLLAESNKDEARAGARAAKKALQEAEQAKLLFDAAVLKRIGRADLAAGESPSTIAKAASQPAAKKVLAPLNPAHMPALFPEVFLRENGGFDVLIGNPPWDEMHVNADKFWVRHFAGHMNYSDVDKEKLRKQYAVKRPDLESDLLREQEETERVGRAIKAVNSATDLYQAFMWRYLLLIAPEGRCGVVLPRGATVGASLEKWRKSALSCGTFTEVFHCVNKGGWLFEAVHPQTQVVLLSYQSTLESVPIFIQGTARSEKDLERLRTANPLVITKVQLEELSQNLIIPAVPVPELSTTFMKIRMHQSLGSLTGDLALQIGVDGTAKTAREARRTKSNAKSALGVIQGKHIRHWTVPRADEWIDYQGNVELRTSPGIGFRQVARSDDSRTFICAPVPAGSFMKETSYWLTSRTKNSLYEVFLLGILSSRIFDWYVRCLVDRRVLPSLAISFPVPEFNKDLPLHMEIVKCVQELFGPTGFEEYGFSGTAVSDADLIGSLEGLVALAYGLEAIELDGLLRTFHPTFDSTKTLESAKAMYKKWDDSND